MPTLFLAQRFPPHTGAAARRLRWLAARFAQAGPVYVIRLGQEGPGIPVVSRTISITNRDLRAAAGQSGKTVAGGLKENPLVRLLLRMRQAFPFVYLTDDGGPHYRRRAFAEAEKLILEEGVTTLVSSFRPWSDHLVAAKLKRKYPALEWFADFRDLPVDPVRKDIWWPSLQQRWGRRAIARADAVWVVSEGQKAQLADWHSRIEVLRNPLLRLPPEENNPATKRFTVVYTGSLYPGLQTIVPLVEALRDLLNKGTVVPENLCLIYRGKDADLFARWASALPPEVLDVDTYIAPAAAQKMQREAQVLLLLNWSAPGYYGVLTAKLWDYLATGPDDPELRGIIEGAAAGAVFHTEEQGLVDWLGTAYAEWAATGTLAHRSDREALAEYVSS